MPESPFSPLVFIVAGYLLGSIPFGLLLSKLFGGRDVRNVGSGNIGATNVARAAGLFAGILTLLLDGAKGAAAVWLAGHYTSESATWMMLAGLAALAGHCFPVWLQFKGGKGVATGAGVFLAICPFALLGSVLLFILVVAFWRYVSLASISAAAAIPLLVYFLWAPRHAPPTAVTLGSLAAAVFIVWRHSANLRRLVEGTEPRFSLGKKKDSA
jgi:acyl phosphate:glycerol-3-phosphate acyltransferase